MLIDGEDLSEDEINALLDERMQYIEYLKEQGLLYKWYDWAVKKGYKEG